MAPGALDLRSLCVPARAVRPQPQAVEAATELHRCDLPQMVPAFSSAHTAASAIPVVAWP